MKMYSACLFGLVIFLISPFVMAQEDRGRREAELKCLCELPDHQKF